MGTEKKEKRKEGDAGTREGHNRRKDHKKGKGSRDRAAQRDREKEERGDARDRDTASTRKKRELSLLSQRRAENLRKAHPREAAGRRSAARAFTPPGTPAFCKRRPSGSPARASRGGDSLRGGGPGSLRFLLPSPPRGGYREYLSCRGPAVPPPRLRPPPQPPIQEAAPLPSPAQRARRASERTFRVFSRRFPGHYAAEQPSPSPPSPPAPRAPPAAQAAQLSAGGGVAQPIADGTLAARPQQLLKSKVGGGRRVPRALRGCCLA